MFHGVGKLYFNGDIMIAHHRLGLIDLLLHVVTFVLAW